MSLVALIVVSVYEVTNYGHEVKWKIGVSSGISFDTSQGGEFESVHASNDTIIAHYQTMNGVIISGIYAFNPEGKVRWSLKDDISYGISTPTMAPDGSVYFAGTLPGANSLSLVPWHRMEA
jgi:outer membrane protein assembly factor BamB